MVKTFDNEQPFQDDEAGATSALNHEARMNRLVRLVLVLLASSTTTACSRPSAAKIPPPPVGTAAAEKAEPAASRVASANSIRIHTLTGWFLTVRDDGSGDVQYGSSFGDGANFPAGTLDFSAIRDHLGSRTKVSGGISKYCSVTFHEPGRTTNTGRCFDDPTYAATLFDRAKSRWTPILGKNNDRLDKIWDLNPPVRKSAE